MKNGKSDWGRTIKLVQGVGALAVVSVYAYSVYLGFGSGWFKGLFMLLVPVVAQIWLFFEEWIFNPCGFSCPYVTYVICAVILCMIGGIIEELANPKSDTNKTGMILLAAGLVVFAIYRYESINRGATKPTDVAGAYVKAMYEADFSIAKYYSAHSKQNLYDFIEKVVNDGQWSKDGILMKYQIGKETGKLRFRSELTFGTPMQANVVVCVEYQGMEIRMIGIVVANESGKWKVSDGGELENALRNMMSASRNVTPRT